MVANREQKQALAKFAGFGGMDAVFGFSSDWANENEELKKAFSKNPRAMRRLQSSVLNAHYTSPLLVRGMWSALQRMGLGADQSQPMNILEPSIGIGNFLGLAPAEIVRNAHFSAVELEPTSAEAARLLYPDAEIRMGGFEDAVYPDDFFDAAISNIPFGNYKPVSIHSDIKNRYAKSNASIHDFFFLKSLDHVRPGGVVAFLTSAYTMDKANPAIRQRIEYSADFVGAVRLPDHAHQSQAGTRVITDMIFLRKRLPGETSRSIPWLETYERDFLYESSGGEAESETVTRNINQYFLTNPHMVLGEMTTSHPGFRGGELNVINPETKDDPEKFAAQLQQAIEQLPAGIISPLQEPAANDEAIKDTLSNWEHPNVIGEPIPGTLVMMSNDTIGVIEEDGYAHPTKIPKSHVDRVTAMIPIREAVLEVLRREQQIDSSDDYCNEARATLNTLYDGFNERFGRLNDKRNTNAFRHDPRAKLLLELEQYKDSRKTEFVSKAEIFSARVMRQAVLPGNGLEIHDAYKAVLAHEGRVNLSAIKRISGQSREAVLERLKGIIYRDPENNRLVPADTYLSGNVVKKLEIAQSLVAQWPEFQENVDALLAVQPEPLRPSEITASFGAPWQSPDDIRDFVVDLLDVPRYCSNDVKVSYSSATGSWRVRIHDRGTLASIDTANKKVYGNEDRTALTLIELKLNNTTPNVTRKVDGKNVPDPKATEVLALMQENIVMKFRQWIWSDPERTERLVAEYNKLFNNTRLPTPDGSHQTFPGMTPTITLDKHQSDVVWMAIQHGRALIAHEVGAGKTFSMAAIAYEWKRIGFANKPVIAVLNHMLPQVTSDVQRLYPGANILAISSKDLNKDNRRRFLAKVGLNNWDMVIMTHSVFTKIELSGPNQQEVIDDQIDMYRQAINEMDDDGISRRTVKQIETRIARLEAHLKAVYGREKDRVITFEQMGIDAIIIDESHKFKNLDIATSLTNVAGVNTKGSQRSLDLLMKTRYLFKKRGSTTGVVFATGTPISNSIAPETYTIQRYLQPDILEEQGTSAFDAWNAVFTEQVRSVEIDVACSKYKTRTRLDMVNIPELITTMRGVMDVKTHSDLNLPKPDVDTIKIAAPLSPAQEFYMKCLAHRVETVKDKKPWEDNMLNIATDGRKMSLDMRVVDPYVGDFDQAKVNKMVTNVVDVYYEFMEDRATQLIFLDMSTPKKEAQWTLYEDIKEKLIAQGIPHKEVAFIHDAKNDAGKERIFAAVRAGEIRVLLGSTEKMGAGTNVQERLVAIHPLDAPWNPETRNQRLGRACRQGNMFDKIREYIYTTTGSFDLYMWQTVEIKSKQIDRIMHGDKSLRAFSEEVDPTYADLMAITTGDPRIREKMDLDNKINSLKIQEKIHNDGQINTRQVAYRSRNQMEFTKHEQKACWSILDQRQIQPEGSPSWAFAGQKATQQTITKHLKTAALKAFANGSKTLEGLTIHGVPVLIALDTEANLSRWYVGGKMDEIMGFPNGKNAETFITTGVDTKNKRMELDILRLQKDIDKANEKSAPFEGAQELKRLMDRRSILVAEMSEAGQTSETSSSQKMAGVTM